MEMSDAEDTIDDVIIQTNPTTAKKPTSEDYYQPAEPTVSVIILGTCGSTFQCVHDNLNVISGSNLVKTARILMF